MPIQCGTDLLISRSRTLLLLLIFHLEPSTLQEAKCFSRIGAYDSSSRAVSSNTPEPTKVGTRPPSTWRIVRSEIAAKDLLLLVVEAALWHRRFRECDRRWRQRAF